MMVTESVQAPVSSPNGLPQYILLNPMHIIHLHDQTRSFTVRLVRKIKGISEKWFTHLLLLALLVLYASLGALLFCWIEGPLEQGEKQSINRTRELVLQKLWDARDLAMPQWLKHAQKRLKEYEEQLEQHFKSKAPPDSERIVWTFWGSLFYAGTIFTTIGYGNIVPATLMGQVVTVVYAFFGIPILLMVLADLGKLFTRWIKAVFTYGRLFYKTGQCRKARKLGRRATAVPLEFLTVAWQKMPLMVYNPKTPKDSEATEQLPSPNQDDDEFHLPVSLAVVLLIIYMMVGAFLFTLWEEWTFFESFYFVFISMSTIGFGDYVPEHPMFMMAAFVYLLFGLALTSMCINVVQEKLSATFEMAKLRIGTTIGLDAHILAESQPGSSAQDEGKTKQLDESIDISIGN